MRVFGLDVAGDSLADLGGGGVPIGPLAGLVGLEGDRLGGAPPSVVVSCRLAKPGLPSAVDFE